VIQLRQVIINRNRIAELRKAAKLSQAALGKIIKAAQNTISQWESGAREPDFETASKLADFFGVSIDYLLGRTDVPENSTHPASSLPENTQAYPAPDPIAAIGFSADLTDEERARLKMVIDITLESILREREQKKNAGTNADTVNEQNKK